MTKVIKYEKSIAYYIEVELGLNLDDIWNWEMNKINPKEISYGNDKYIWVYCQNHDYHNFDEYGNKIGYKIRCADFHNGKRCGYCNSFASHKVHWKDSLAYIYPNIAEMIAIKENNLTFKDCYNISCHSGKKFYFKCNKCNSISNKKYTLSQITTYGYPCKYCSDGISIPNKFIANILNQLNIDFITELSKSENKWCGYFRYDFYLPKYNMIIEANGLQHYEESNRGKSLFEEQMNDLFKYKCAKNHVNNYIVIDCRYSTLEWLKENIIKELGSYFDLSNINWELAWKESQNSLCIKAWEIYENGIQNTKEISSILNLHQSTVISYLKRGNKCNMCSYNPKKGARKYEK